MRARRFLLLTAASAITVFEACSTTETVVDGTRGEAGVGEASTDATATIDVVTKPDGGDAAPCPGTAGPSMVRVGVFCIDSREVNNEDYSAFIDACSLPGDH